MHHTPRILLLCGHTLCQTCLQALIEQPGHEFNCSQCATPHTCDSVDSFPVNKALLSLSPDVGCHTHGERHKAYCHDCGQLLCMTCILDDGHSSHSLTSVEDAAATERSRIHELSDQADAMEAELRKLMSQMTSHVQSQRKQAHKNQQQLAALFE